MKTLTLILITALALTSCMTADKAIEVLKKKDLLDDVCATEYPRKDSIGEPVIDTTHRVHNEDYTETIARLQRQVEATNEALAAALARAGDSAASEVAKAYQKQLLQAQRQLSAVKEEVAALKAKYKPCQPDTVMFTIPMYQRDPAYEDVLKDQIVALEKTIGQKEVQIGVLQSQLQEITQKKNWWRMWGGFVTWGAIALVVMGIVFRSRLPF